VKYSCRKSKPLRFKCCTFFILQTDRQWLCSRVCFFYCCSENGSCWQMVQQIKAFCARLPCVVWWYKKHSGY